jgi:hypothetical protein
LKSIANIIADEDIHLIVDETMDVKKRYVFNMLIGVLNGNPTIPMLFIVSFLEITNAENIHFS